MEIRPNDKEVADWMGTWIGKGCSASSAIYKFRNWLKERESASQEATTIESALPMAGVVGRSEQLFFCKHITTRNPKEHQENKCRFCGLKYQKN